MEFAFKYFWIMFIVVTMINVQIYKYRFKQCSEKNPELEYGYKKIIKALLIYGNMPWIIMGVGTLLGSTSSIFNYFNPRGLNPFVLMFHASLIYIYVILIKFIYFSKGAEFLEKHKGLFERASFGGQNTIVTSTAIKLWVGLMLIGGIVAMIAMWTINFSI